MMMIMMMTMMVVVLVVVEVVVSVLAAYRLNIYLKMLLRIYMYSGSCILYTTYNNDHTQTHINKFKTVYIDDIFLITLRRILAWCRF